MTWQNDFAALVRHEFKWSRHVNITEGKHRASRWILFYVALAIIFGISFFTYVVLRQNFQPQYMWYFTFWLPWMAFGFAIHIVGREWQHNTFGWWLALPYSRIKLIAAKYVAILLQACIVYCGAFTVIILLSLYYQLLPGHLPVDMSTFLLWGLLFFTLFIAIFPFMAAAGILIGILTKSRKKPVLPLLGIVLWALFGGFFWLLSFNDGDINLYTSLSEASSTVYFPVSPLLIGIIVISWIAAWLILMFAAHVLERDLNV